MRTTLSMALFLSSKGQAKTYISEGSGAWTHEIYQLLVSCSGEEMTFTLDDTLTLQVYRITYPDRRAGRGWGEPVVATQPHRVVQRQGLRAMLDYLAFIGVHTTEAVSAWEPVEDAIGEDQEQKKE